MEPKTSGTSSDNVVIENNRGVRVTLHRGARGFALGMISLNENQLEVPLTQGLFCVRHVETHAEQWIAASEVETPAETKAILCGEANVEDIPIRFRVCLETPPDVRSVRLTYEFDVEEDLEGYEICLQYHTDYANQWRAHLYPWVADSKWVERVQLDNMGIPSAFLYRDDRTLGLLWGIDPNSDYLNPTTWTRDFGLYFVDGVQPAQFRVGGGKLQRDIHYHCPLQIVLTDCKDPDSMIKDLLQAWIRLNRYEVIPLHVRTNDEALHHFIEGRRESMDAWIPGKGYSLHGAHHTFLYFGVQSMGAYFDYLLYEMTGERLWRQRAFDQMDFIIQGQNRDRTDFNFGAVHTTYQLEWMDDYGPSGPGFNSDDRFNVGYKPDICALLVRYMLMMWQRVKDHEGIDRQDWYETATLAADWIARQQNNDGGLAQKVQVKPLEMRWMDDEHNLVIQPFKSRSSASGRALPSLWKIHQITGDPKYRNLLDGMETYTLNSVQNQYYYTGHHPDLPPYELEEASIWGIAEYWLNRYDETGDEAYLHHAEANAYLALSWWCPKDLSWVNNPTQGGSAEQQHFQQYSVYNYQNRKVEGLWRLYRRTGNPLFKQLFDRILQTIYFTQETEGGNRGGTYERIADPWLVRSETLKGEHFDSMGTNYTNEQALDCFLQVLEIFRMGESFYAHESLVHTVYPDGACYYSQDISDMLPAPLKVWPSAGTIQVVVHSWQAEQKRWAVRSPLQEEVTITHRIQQLAPLTWYEVYSDGNVVGSYQSDPSGELAFSWSGKLETDTIFSLKIG